MNIVDTSTCNTVNTTQKTRIHAHLLPDEVFPTVHDGPALHVAGGEATQGQVHLHAHIHQPVPVKHAWKRFSLEHSGGKIHLEIVCFIFAVSNEKWLKWTTIQHPVISELVHCAGIKLWDSIVDSLQAHNMKGVIAHGTY